MVFLILAGVAVLVAAHLVALSVIVEFCMERVDDGELGLFG